MGNTYETDLVDGKDAVELTVRTAIIVKRLGNLIGCRSWLVARLAYSEVAEAMDELRKIIEKGIKNTNQTKETT